MGENLEEKLFHKKKMAGIQIDTRKKESYFQFFKRLYEFFK